LHKEKMRMLVLSRKVGETLLIGEGVAVQVLGVRGRQIRLGVVAPTDVRIRRAELGFDFAVAARSSTWSAKAVPQGS
jgi:carbon storage regulator